MAVTYTNNYSAPGSQTLPSFRELLPQHLHEEIDRTSYPQSADRHRTQEGAYKSRSGMPSLPHPSNPVRGPSPILPPLRDISGRHSQHHERPMSSYDTSSRSRSGYGSGRESSYSNTTTSSSRASTMSMDDERYRSGVYAGGTPPAMYGNQNAYDPARYPAQYPTSYPASTKNEYDYAISPMATHSHTLPASSPAASNFGVISGDPLDSRGKRRRGNLPKPVTDVLRAWFHEHLDHPYPTEEDKQVFMNQTGLSISQISNWFINARRRQLPALRNQLRHSDGEHMRGGSPMSDGDVSMSPPHSHSTTSPTRRHR